MFKHLRKYNETLFLMIVFLLFSGSVLFFNYQMSSRVLLVKKENQKITQSFENLSEKLSELSVLNNQVDEQVKKYNVSKENTSNKPEGTPSGEVFFQNIDKNKLLDLLKTYKDNLVSFSHDVSKLTTDQENNQAFSLGNLPDGSLKNSLYLDLSQLSQKSNSIIAKIDFTNEELVNNFSESKNFEELLTTFKTNSVHTQKLFNDRVVSITKEIRIIQVTSALGIASLFFVLIVIIFGKLIKTDESIDIITQENANILKSVKEGLFLISSDLFVGTQISQSTSKILERDIKEHDNFDMILQELVDERTYIQAIDYIRVLLTGNIKEALVQSLNPLNEIKIKSGQDNEKYLSMFFNRIKKNGQVISLLVTIQDITKQVIISRELKEAKNLARREIEAILNTVSQNKGNLMIFLENMESTITQINSTLQNIHDGMDYRKELNHIYRLVHKVKGEASMFGFSFFYEFCHQFEDLLNNLLRNENINGDIMLTVAVNLETLIQKTNIIKKIINKSDLIDQATESRTQVSSPSRPEVNETAQNVTQSVPVATVAPQEKITVQEPTPVVPVTPAIVEKIVEKETSFEENVLFLISEMNHKLNKNISLDMDMHNLNSLPKDKQNKIKDIIVQLVRNAGVHAFNSTNTGTITINLEKNGEEYLLTCADNGDGIDVNAIKEQIKKKYNVDDSVLADKTETQILSFIFKPGFSTAKEENIFGGRGVGLDLVAQTIKELSGKIRLSTKVGQGTQFMINFN